MLTAEIIVKTELHGTSKRKLILATCSRAASNGRAPLLTALGWGKPDRVQPPLQHWREQSICFISMGSPGKTVVFHVEYVLVRMNFNVTVEDLRPPE